MTDEFCVHLDWFGDDEEYIEVVASTIEEAARQVWEDWHKTGWTWATVSGADRVLGVDLETAEYQEDTDDGWSHCDGIGTRAEPVPVVAPEPADYLFESRPAEPVPHDWLKQLSEVTVIEDPEFVMAPEPDTIAEIIEHDAIWERFRAATTEESREAMKEPGYESARTALSQLEERFSNPESLSSDTRVSLAIDFAAPFIWDAAVKATAEHCAQLAERAGQVDELHDLHDPDYYFACDVIAAAIRAVYPDTNPTKETPA